MKAKSLVAVNRKTTKMMINPKNPKLGETFHPFKVHLNWITIKTTTICTLMYNVELGFDVK